MKRRFGQRVPILTMVTAVLLSVGLFGTPTASAADTAYLTRVQYLPSQPEDLKTYGCQERTINLASGNYAWGQVYIGRELELRDIYLAADTYSWDVCIVGWEDHYLIVSNLTGSAGNQATVSNMEWNVAARAGREISWGAFLDPYF